jgi:hypothetical protein
MRYSATKTLSLFQGPDLNHAMRDCAWSMRNHLNCLGQVGGLNQSEAGDW